MIKQLNKIGIPKNSLIQLYNLEGLSTGKIAKIYNCNSETIRRRLIYYNIKRRHRYEDRRKLVVSKEILEDLYQNKLHSTINIAKLYNCSQDTVYRALKRLNIKTRSPNEFTIWKDVGNIKNPNLEYSNDLAYILGVLYGDGWVYKYNYTYSIGLETIDKEFTLAFSSALEKIGLHTNVFLSDKYWRCVSISRKFYDWFENLSISNIVSIVGLHPKKFIKGFYESEGCLSNRLEKGKYNYKTIIITNTEEWLMQLTKNLLQMLGFHPCLYLTFPKSKNRKPIWRLYLFRQKEIFNFINNIKPCIKNQIRKL